MNAAVMSFRDQRTAPREAPATFQETADAGRSSKMPLSLGPS
jgi:hypothetical protein